MMRQSVRKKTVKPTLSGRYHEEIIRAVLAMAKPKRCVCGEMVDPMKCECDSCGRSYFVE